MTNEHAPKVGIIVLNWNNYDDSARCLESIKNVEYPDYKIYLVDNGSTDQSIERLVAKYHVPCVEFVLNHSNLGFAAGCNRGIEVALKDRCDYILLLNNDCVICDVKFLRTAVGFAEATPECGILGGKLLFWPETARIWSTGGRVSRFGVEMYIGHGEVDRGQYDEIAERGFISGALMLIKREVIERIGMLPEAYFFGKEDWEYSVNAIKRGYKLFYHPGCIVCHEGSHSHAPTDPTYMYNSILSKILYVRRNNNRALFYCWLTAFWCYGLFLLPIRFWVKPQSYLKGISLATIRQPMLAALRESHGINVITRDTLDMFRRAHQRSEERRVGKECRSRWSPYH